MPVRVQAYKFRLYAVDQATESLFWQHAGAGRWLNNELVVLHELRHKQGKKFMGFALADKLLSAARKHPKTAWLADLSRPALTRAVANHYAGWDRFWDDQKKPKHARIGVNPPQLKKKGQHDAFGWSGAQHCRLDAGNKRIKVPKIGWLRFRADRRQIQGVVKNVTISRRGKHWYISIQTEREIAEVKLRTWHRKTQRVGLDMGIACHTVASDGTPYPGPRALKRGAINLARKQRQLARKVKGSKRHKKQLALIRRIHERIANVRLDHLHQTTTEISKNHGLVAIEDLKVRNMSKSAKGTKDAPGVNVRAKSGLNREILDQGWSEFRRHLTYKQAWSGGTLVAVPPRNTSRMCSSCAHTDKANRPSQAVFICGGCGVSLHADVNAAKNILAAGLAATARVGYAKQSARNRVPSKSPCAA